MLFGILPIVLTPFTDSGDLDMDSFRNLLKFYHRNGVDGVTCLGEVSETQFLTDDEQMRIVQCALETSNAKPVVSGIWGKDLSQAMRKAEEMENMGVNGLLIPPPEGSVDNNEILNFYMEIDRRVSIPIVMLDHPSPSRTALSPSLISQIYRKTEHCKFLKIEDPPTNLKMEKLQNEIADGLNVLGASHGRYFYWELECGSKGLMTSTTVPETHAMIWKYFISGRKEEALDLYMKTLPLCYFMEQTPLEVKKEIFVNKGIILNSFMRSSRKVLTDSSRAQLKELLKWSDVNLIK
jgi:4-hydroxy-tetrahydrodipicolinate synthase